MNMMHKHLQHSEFELLTSARTRKMTALLVIQCTRQKTHMAMFDLVLRTVKFITQLLLCECQDTLHIIMYLDEQT